MNPTAPQNQQAAPGLHSVNTTHATIPTAATKPARLLRLPAVLERTGLGKSSVYTAMASKKFPTPVRLGTRGVAWRESEIDAWVQSLQTAEIRPVFKARKVKGA